jgi:hypothetical protein
VSLLSLDLHFFEVSYLTCFWLLALVSFLGIGIGMRLSHGTPEWTLANGYMNLWHSLHVAEEASLMFAPLEKLVAVATFDEERLRNSSITNAQALIFRLQQARAVLIVKGNLNKVWRQPVYNRAEGPQVERPVSLADELVARQWIREARSAINTYRDGSWNSLVLARNSLYSSIFMTSLFGLMAGVVCVVASDDVEPKHVVAAAALYLTGAMVGLLNQLRLDRDSQGGVEDYGLSWARRLNTPVLSGLTGLAAAILIPMVSATALEFSSPAKTPTPTPTLAVVAAAVSPGAEGTITPAPSLTPLTTPSPTPSPTPTPIPSPTPSVTPKPGEAAAGNEPKATATPKTGTEPKMVAADESIPALHEILDLRQNRRSLLLAAIFGLTPTALISRLQSESEKYKTNITSSSASTGEST